MKVLLDSHAFVWWIASNDRLSGPARAAIDANDVFVSAVTAYELCFKSAHGRMSVFDELDRVFVSLCEEQSFYLLPISVDHALAAARLNPDHRDPFDRLLAAQSMIEGMPLVTIDPAFKQFDCRILW